MWDQARKGAVTQSVGKHVCIAGVSEGEDVCLVEHVSCFFVDWATAAQELGIESVRGMFCGPENGLCAGEEERVGL